MKTAASLLGSPAMELSLHEAITNAGKITTGLIAKDQKTFLFTINFFLNHNLSATWYGCIRD